MKLVRQFARRPQGTWVWRANFHVHLWVGLILAVYLIVIGVTGAILVFRGELEAIGRTPPWPAMGAGAPLANVSAVIGNVKARYPRAQIVTVTAPTAAEPVFVVRMQNQGRGRAEATLAADPVTGAMLGPVPRRTPKAWLRVIERLHVTLLAGPPGRQYNGVLAGLLLLINLTGLVVWWSGLKYWRRALFVDFRRSWKRVNFDLHRAAGFWTFGLLSLWAFSGVYFGFPSQMFALFDRISPIVSAKPPVVTVRSQPESAAPDLDAMIAQARLLDPGTSFKGLAFPASRRGALRIFMQRGNGSSDEYTDTLYFDPNEGALLETWRYGVNQSFGDWLVWSEIPLHFGTYWGLEVKIIWALVGLSIPALTVSGALMYWNRFLSKKWRWRFARHRTPPATTPLPAR